MAATCELIEVIGREQLIRLQAAIGPAQTYIPIKASQNHPIASAIGVESMARICFEWGGSTIWIGNGYANLQRNAEIIRMVLTGIPSESISRRFGVTARYVRILAQAERQQVYSRRHRHARRRRALEAFGRRPISRRSLVQGMERYEKG